MRQLISNNLITKEEQVGRGVYQEFHERLPDYLRRVTMRHQHVHHAVERKQNGNLGDDQQLRRSAFAAKAGNA